MSRSLQAVSPDKMDTEAAIPWRSLTKLSADGHNNLKLGNVDHSYALLRKILTQNLCYKTLSRIRSELKEKKKT